MEPALEPSESDIIEEPRNLNAASSPIVVGIDLAFTDQALEDEFIKEHNRAQVFYDVRLFQCLF